MEDIVLLSSTKQQIQDKTTRLDEESRRMGLKINKEKTKAMRINARNQKNIIINGQNIKSVNPKISRIGRQKRKNEFFLIWPKEPIWLPVFGNDIKRFDFLFFSSKFAKLENSATGPSAAAMRLEI